MRQYNLEKTEKITKSKAIFVTFLVHFGLLYGLFYMNSDKVQDIMPSFVIEWVNGDTAEETVASHTNRP